MVHGGHFVQQCRTFEQIVNIPSIEDPMWNLVKIGQAVSEKKDVTQFYTFI